MLKPSELKKKNFTKAVRGYSIPEVDEYMSFLLEKYTELFRKNFELEQQLRNVMDQKSELESDKESVRNAIINAQKAASKIVNAANERADAIIESAKLGCNAILVDFNEQINAERNTILKLKEQVSELKRDLFKKYREHIEAVEALTEVSETVDVKSSEEYLREAVEKAEKALKKMKPEEKPEVNVSFKFGDTIETNTVSIDEDELFEDGDTVVFEKIVPNTDDAIDNSDTVVIDRIKDEEN